MQKNFKYLITIALFIICNLGSYAQNKVYYKDVLLNGKPAKLNLSTGEFIVESTKGVDTIVPSKQNDNLSKVNMDYHFVKKGETLLKLADMYGATLKELKDANYLKTTLIREGQKLRIRNFNKVKEEESFNIWEVKKGHTLYYISKKTNISIEKIKRLNGLKNNTLSIGQKLYLK